MKDNEGGEVDHALAQMYCLIDHLMHRETPKGYWDQPFYAVFQSFLRCGQLTDPKSYPGF